MCRKCAGGTMEFNERVRDASTSVTAPAWACDACGAVERVRGESADAAALRYQARHLRVKSMRTLMRSRTARLGAERVMAKSAARKKRKTH